jgi:hypothetical protein
MGKIKGKAFWRLTGQYRVISVKMSAEMQGLGESPLTRAVLGL